MIDVSLDKQTRTITVKMTGRITEADQDAAAAAFDERAGAAAAVRIRGSVADVKALLDWEELEGWEMGAKSLGTILGLSIRDALSRVAVIADPKWHGEQDRLADICNRAKVRFFTPDRRAEATTWLAS